MARAGQAAVVKVALRSRESLALLRVKDKVLLMHTMLWPDELRNGSFAEPPADVAVSEAEMGMATMFIEQLSGEFDPAVLHDDYREALEQVVEAKLRGVEAPKLDEAPKDAEVVDLVAALRASVEAAKKRREEAAKAV